MPPPFQILCDFDGTIALEDVTDTILSQLADPRWIDIEQDWAEGRIGSRACMTRQVSLLRGSWQDLDDVVATVAIDPFFRDFVAFCAARNLPLTIVSDGLDAAIGGILAREGLSLPVRANRLVRSAAGTWSLDTPLASTRCRVDAAHCKCLSLDATQDIPTVVIGDGRSDQCVAERAVFVFARSLSTGPSALLRHCRAQGLSHLPYDTFADIIAGLDALVPRTTRSPASIMESERHG